MSDQRDQEKDSSRLAERLTSLGYVQLFFNPEDTLESIWSMADAPAALDALLEDRNAPVQARFLAAEVLASKGELNVADEQKGQVAHVYAMALDRHYAEVANTWGIPGYLEGLAGEHLLALGEPAVPELTHLLDNDDPVHYAGSQEATLGNSLDFRVKDLAAYFIARIRGMDFSLPEDPQERDFAISRLKSNLQQ